MFQKGDLIVYGNMGVCRVEAVEAPAGLPGAGEKKLYYKLDPVYETGTVYIPVDAKVFMRPILTHAQAEALIGRIPEIEENPCGGKDQQMRWASRLSRCRAISRPRWRRRAAALKPERKNCAARGNGSVPHRAAFCKGKAPVW